MGDFAPGKGGAGGGAVFPPTWVRGVGSTGAFPPVVVVIVVVVAGGSGFGEARGDVRRPAACRTQLCVDCGRQRVAGIHAIGKRQRGVAVPG